MATAVTALGFLPAVVVHSLLRTGDEWRRRPAALAMTIMAYGLSATAGALHFQQAIIWWTAPSQRALRVLTIGFATLTIALLFIVRRQSGWRRSVWVAALAVFAVSALHLSHHEWRDYSWRLEVIGRHASLPLVVAILYEDYRFALADIFLKRALALVLLVASAFGLYLNVAAPLLERRERIGGADPLSVGLLIGLWVATALVYPWLRGSVARFVDALLLRRIDYEAMRVEIARRIANHEAAEPILDEVCEQFKASLTAREVKWTADRDNNAGENSKTPTGSFIPFIKKYKTSRRLKEPEPRAATVLVPVAESPQYQLLIGELAGGRRLLSDDLDFLESVALLVARRIDAVRVIHERCLLRVPTLLIQPLVENAIKHGISPCRAGGEVAIQARLTSGRSNQIFAPVGATTSTEDTLQMWVRDTGVGANEQELAYGRTRGIGLQNVEQRIKRHYGDAATFGIRGASGVGTTAELSLPVNFAPGEILNAVAGGAAVVAAETTRRKLE